MTDPDVRLLVERYRAGWFGHDLDAIMAVVSDDIVFHNVTAQERVEGAAAFIRGRSRRPSRPRLLVMAVLVRMPEPSPW